MSGKRSDFLILIPNFGFIFVDIKNLKITHKYNSYPIYANKSKKYSSLQIKFNMYRMYAISNE